MAREDPPVMRGRMRHSNPWSLVVALLLISWVTDTWPVPSRVLAFGACVVLYFATHGEFDDEE